MGHFLDAELVEIASRVLMYGCIELDCGCVVEPDGSCPHGNRSPLIDWGMI